MSRRTKYCGIYSCVNSHGTTNLDEPFFAVPSEAKPTLRKRWIDAIKALYGVDFKSGRLCGLHFHPNDYFTRYFSGSNTKEYVLKPGAIPSIPSQLIGNIKTEPDIETVDIYSDGSQENAFKFVDIESIKNSRTIGNVETYQPTHMEMSFESKLNVCHQCNEWERKYKRMQKRCQELSRENENLKRQLLNNTENISDVRTNADSFETSNSFENVNPVANATARDDTVIEVKQEQVESHNLYMIDDDKPCVSPAVNEALDPPATSKQHNTYKCNKCKAWFKKGENLVLHMKFHDKPTPDELQFGDFECYLCKVKARTYKQMSSHLKKHVLARSIKCLVCNEGLTPKEDKEHLCYGEKTISCDYCNVSFNAMSKLLQHLNIHSDRTMRRCRKCPRLMAMQQLVVWHEKIHENEEPRPFICNVCSKSFRVYNIMKSHMKTHTTADFLCSECGKGFKDEKALRYHNLSHGDKLIKCPDCPFTCRRKQSLKYHSDVHKNVTYKCPKCVAEFSTRRGLYKHSSLRHREGGIEKKHQCTYCPQKFHDSDKLVTHLRKHTNEKPFICEICPDKKYKYKGDLNKHMRVAHLGENMYKCKLCDEGFRTDWQLNRHSFVHYKEENNPMEIDS